MQDQLNRIEQKLDKLLEKKKPVKRRSSKVEYSGVFERLWSYYPRRAGSNPKHRAYQCFVVRVKEGCNQQAIIASVVAYAKFCDAANKTGTEFVMQAATFFGPEKYYENDWSIPVNKNLPKNNDELQAWAVDNGYRIAAPGETYAQYRQALEQLRRG